MDGALEAKLAEVVDREEIRTLIYRFARGADRNDAELRDAVIWDDAVFNYGIFDGPAKEYVEWVRQQSGADGAVPFVNAQHLNGQSLILLDGDRATAETSMLTHMELVDDRQETYFQVIGGRYFDRFERRSGIWKMSERNTIIDWKVALRSDPSCPEFQNFEKFRRGSGWQAAAPDLTYQLGFDVLR